MDEIFKNLHGPADVVDSYAIDMEEFDIQANDEYREWNFRLKAVGNQWYEIYDERLELLGEIKIDQQNHEHCETKGCTLDLPILKSIRKNIFLHTIFEEEE